MSRLRQAHRIFEEKEPRNLFYQVATHLVESSRRPSAKLTLAESLAVLLQTWNAQYYRFPRQGRPAGFRHENLSGLQRLLGRHHADLEAYRKQLLRRLTPSDAARVRSLFSDFEGELGTVGAAKALHLLAPRFFPLWDRAIARGAYHLSLSNPTGCAGAYERLIAAVNDEISSCGGWGAFSKDENPVKLIDELHYCECTLREPVP